MSISDEAVKAEHIPNAELYARGIRFCPGCKATRLRRQSVGADVITMSEANFTEALAQAWDAAITRGQQRGGSLVENPYRTAP